MYLQKDAAVDLDLVENASLGTSESNESIALMDLKERAENLR